MNIAKGKKPFSKLNCFGLLLNRDKMRVKTYSEKADKKSQIIGKTLKKMKLASTICKLIYFLNTSLLMERFQKERQN